MKKHFKTLLALICAFVCLVASAVVFTSCSTPACKHANVQTIEAQNPTGPLPGNTLGYTCLDCGEILQESIEYYHVNFVFNYKAVEGRQNVEHSEDLLTVRFDKGNTGFTAEQIAEVNALSFHGFTFADWYGKWDKKTYELSEPFDFTAPITANATVYASRGNLVGPNATWELVETENSTATNKLYELKINGTGDMFDVSEPSILDIPWYKEISKIEKLTIAEGITSVGAHILNASGTTSLIKEINLPSTIKKIGNGAFVGAKIKTFTAPPSLEVICTNAFKQTSLNSLVLNEGLTTIESAAFQESKSIKYVVVPTTLKSVGNGAFYPGSNGATAADHSLAKVYYLGSNIEDFNKIDVAMDNIWFNEMPVIYCYTEDKAKGETGGYWRYADAEKTIPLQYTFAIRYCLPTGSRLPFAVDYIKINTEDKDNNGLPDTNAEGDVIMSAAITAENIKFRDELRYHGFKFSSFSNDITLGKTITADLKLTGQRGDILSDDGNVIWSYTSNTITVKLKDKTNGTKKMWDFETPNDTTPLWAGGIANLANVKKIVIEDGVEYIGKYAFAMIINVPEVYIPESVKEIHPNAFDGCTNLANVYYMGADLTKCKNINELQNIKYMSFSKAAAPTAADGDWWLEIGGKKIGWSLHDGKLVIAGDSQMMDFTAPNAAPWYGAKDRITSVSVARNITTIGKNIANAYTNVMEIHLNSNLTKIPQSAFEGTGLLNSTANFKNGMLVIDGNLLRVSRIDYATKTLFECNTDIKNIAGGAFVGTAVTEVFLCKSVTYLDKDAFANSSVKNIYVEGRPATWTTIAQDFGNPAGINVYFYSANQPTDTTNKYYHKDASGKKYVIWP